MYVLVHPQLDQEASSGQIPNGLSMDTAAGGGYCNTRVSSDNYQNLKKKQTTTIVSVHGMLLFLLPAAQDAARVLVRLLVLEVGQGT